MKEITPSDRAAALVSRLDRKGGMVSVDALALEQMVTEAIQAESNAQLLRGRAADRQADVAAFIRKFGQGRRESPGWPEQKDLDMRVRLIAEEFCEFLRDCGYDFTVYFERWFDTGGEVPQCDLVFSQASDREEPSPSPNFAKAADALIDMEYVILGTHEAMGIDSRPLWAEVHKCNMAKEGGATREDGKICKPPGFVPPDIASCLRKQGWRPDSDIIDAEFEMLPTDGSTGR